jgi:PDZ domain/Aspartyl protease
MTISVRALIFCTASFLNSGLNEATCSTVASAGAGHIGRCENSLSEACNLKSVQADGGNSSAIRFPENQSSAHVPFELLANCPYIKVKVNGKGPFLFVIDTGSIDTVFASETISELGIRSADSSDKPGNVEFAFAGGLQVKTESVDTLSLSGLWPLIGRRTYGIIGYDVLKQFVVEFDYENKTVTFYDPKNYKYAGSGAMFDAKMEMGYDPQVPGELEVLGVGAIQAPFTIDTGAGGTVVTTPLVQKNRLMEKVIQKVPSPGQGVNGMQFNDVVGRMGSIRLGNFILDQPLVALSLDTDGPLSSEVLGVNVGGNVLQRFKLIINYPRRQLILQPNSRLHDPFPADASGLVLEALGDDFKTITVRGVVDGSPADQAGIREGDIIESIDGETTGKYALWQIQDLFKNSGEVRVLTLLTKDKTLRTVKIKLRALA